MSHHVEALIRLLPEWQLGVIRFNDSVASRLGIAGSDLQCLFVLDRGGPTSPGAIAKSVGLTTGSASRMIDRLLAADLVTRDPDPDDRRRVIVAIRPDASKCLHGIYDPLDDRLRDLLAQMTATSLEEFRRFVEGAISTTGSQP